MKKEEKIDDIYQSDKNLTLNWKKMSFFSIVFFTVLFIDVLFLSYFIFNYFFMVHKDPEVSFCLYDSYLDYLETKEVKETEDLCNGFFLTYENYEKCGEFGSLSDFCLLIFIEEYETYEKCDLIEEEEMKFYCLINQGNYGLDPLSLMEENYEI